MPKPTVIKINVMRRHQWVLAALALFNIMAMIWGPEWAQIVTMIPFAIEVLVFIGVYWYWVRKDPSQLGTTITYYPPE